MSSGKKKSILGANQFELNTVLQTTWRQEKSHVLWGLQFQYCTGPHSNPPKSHSSDCDARWILSWICSLSLSKYTVITGKSVYKWYLVKGLFHSRLCGFFPINISPEAEGKISTNPSLMELFPQISVNISVYTFTEQERSLLKFHNAQKPLGENIKLKIFQVNSRIWTHDQLLLNLRLCPLDCWTFHDLNLCLLSHMSLDEGSSSAW